MRGLGFIKTAAAVTALVVGGFTFVGSTTAEAATVTCTAFGTPDITNRVSPSNGCEVATGATQDFTSEPLTVNTEAFFNITNWVFEGKLDSTGSAFGNEEPGNTGSFDLTGLVDAGRTVMLVFKGGNNPIVGYRLTGLTGTWINPFTDPPFDLPGQSIAQDVSHISVYTQIPLPAAGWLLLGGLGALGAVARRNRRKAA